jgi:membrane protein YdbS with pleckstrin-like domain
MKQSKMYSVIETIIQTAIGLVTSILIQIILYPFLGIPVSFKQNLIITVVFLIVSLIRGYLVRRFFNKLKIFKKIN